MEFALVIYKFFARGGAQRDLIRTALALQERSCRVTVLCAEASDPPPQGCSLQLLPAKGWSNHARMKSFEQSLRQYRQEHPALIVMGFGRMGGLDFYFAADDCLRTLWKNSLLNKFLPRKKVFLELEKAALATPVVFSLTARQERDYCRFYKLDKSKFKRLPPGIDRKYQKIDISASNSSELRKKFNVPEANIVKSQYSFTVILDDEEAKPEE